MNSGPFINPIFYIPLDKSEDNSSQILNFSDSSIMSAGTTSPAVQIFYNGSGVHDVAATTPLMTLAHEFNRTEAGILLSINHKITLNGKIYDKANTTSGITYVLATEKKLRDLFANKAIGTFEVKCNGTTILSLSGVKTNSINTENSPDFLTKSLGYTVELSAVEGLSPNESPVSQASDSWSIEPLDEYDSNYESFTLNPLVKPEIDNPNNVGGLAGGARALEVIHIPRFKISHKLMAKGIANTDSTTAGYYNSYDYAKQWVQKRLKAPWSSSNASGVYFGGNFLPTTMSTNKLFLYNHVRSTNFSITEGTYELTDTWLGMPSGVQHTEDYTIDVKTDERHVKTVSVQGSIKGLSIIDQASAEGTNATILPSGSGYISLGDYGSNRAVSATSAAHQLDSNSPGVSASNANKYLNATKAWHSGIKPVLYRRASAALNAYRYTNNFLPYNYNRETAPENPIYRKEPLLNIIPVSTSETHDPRKGIINYNYEFNNKYALVSGAISENITVEDTGPNDVIAEIFVIGRRLGPVIQSLNAKTSAKRTVSVEITVMPVTGINGYLMNHSDCPLYTGGTVYNTIDKLINGLKPFGNRDASVFSAARGAQLGQVYQTDNSISWNPTEGRFTRRATWVYQQCNTSRLYLDN